MKSKLKVINKKDESIGIITFHNVYNYGGMLQAYALEKTLEELNYNVKIINYQNLVFTENYSLKLQYSKNLALMLKNLIKYILFHKKDKKRFYNFDLFLEQNLVLTEKVTDFNLKNNRHKSDFNILITGSDQVWNPEITKGLSDIYTLNFGNNDIKRISYAASIGTDKINKEMQDEYKSKISKLDCISVREESGAKALQKIISNKKIDVVLDPTLLLTRNDWNKIASEGIKEENKYILAYIVEKNPEQVKIIDKISELTGLKVIHFEKIGHYKNILKSAYTYGPESFVSLIKNAEYIVTTSFHATVFSIIFNKKFWVVPHKTTGSRVTDLLAKLGISNRAVNTLEEFEKRDYNEEIDYNKVNKILEKEREKSIKWLKDAIEK